MEILHPLVCRRIDYLSEEYQKALALRFEVLRQPLGLAFIPEQVTAESADFHLACFSASRFVGVLLLVPQDAEQIKMRQVAVAPAFQGQGVGRALVGFAEAFARQRGWNHMTLHARATAVPFYEKLGYVRSGEMFEEVTLPHWLMNKPLDLG